MPQLTIVFSDDTTLNGSVYKGLTICDALKQIGNTSRMNCGGQARCASCKIKVIDGHSSLSEITEKEIKRLSRENVSENYRLACQALIQGDLVIHSSN